MAQERAADQQQVSETKLTDTAFELKLIGVDEIGNHDGQLLLLVTGNTAINTIVKTATKRYGKGVHVLVRYQGSVLPQNQRVRDLGIQGDAQLYMEKVEYEPAPKRAKTVETDYEPLDQEHDENEATKENEEPKRELTEEEKKLLDELWSWKTSIDMQQVSHFGDEESKNPWKILQEKKKEDVAQNQELLNHLAALRYQYSSGFTGRPKRKRTSQMSYQEHMPGQPSRDTQASSASHKMPKLGDVRSRIYMGLPLVQPTASALDRVYASHYGAHNYDRPWDECEATGVTPQRLEAELVELDQKYHCKW